MCVIYIYICIDRERRERERERGERERVCIYPFVQDSCFVVGTILLPEPQVQRLLPQRTKRKLPPQISVRIWFESCDEVQQGPHSHLPSYCPKQSTSYLPH